MHRFLQTALVLICLVGAAPGCSSTAGKDDATRRATIDSRADSALSNLYASVSGSQDVTTRAAGVLVFDDITKTAFLVGTEHGEGALRVGGKTIGYYKIGGLSFGLGVGAERQSMALAFMTPEALQHFQNSSGWDVGGDASVAVVRTGASGSVDASTLNKPVQVFVYGDKGLMANLSLGGTKITKLDL